MTRTRREGASPPVTAGVLSPGQGQIASCCVETATRAPLHGSARRGFEYGRLEAYPTGRLHCGCPPERFLVRNPADECAKRKPSADQRAARGVAGICDLADRVRLFGWRVLLARLWPRRGDADLCAWFSRLDF